MAEFIRPPKGQDPDKPEGVVGLARLHSSELKSAIRVIGLLLSSQFCELLVTVKKRNGTVSCTGGRERPHPTFGRLGRKKVGSLPPVSVFFPR